MFVRNSSMWEVFNATRDNQNCSVNDAAILSRNTRRDTRIGKLVLIAVNAAISTCLMRGRLFAAIEVLGRIRPKPVPVDEEGVAVLRVLFGQDL